MGVDEAAELIAAADVQPAGTVLPGLAEVAAAVLLAVARSDRDWWVRRAAVDALAGRVDDHIAAGLLAIALDDTATTEVRRAALDVLSAAGRRAVVPELRALRIRLAAAQRPPYGLDRMVVLALARLGDLTVAEDALELYYSRWRVEEELGDEAVPALLGEYGADRFARQFGAASALRELGLGHPRAVVRRWAIARSGPDAPWLADALADDDPLVIEGARRAVREAAPEIEHRLAALAADHAVAPRVRAESVLALLHRGRRAQAQASWRDLGRIELPGVPPEVRTAVLSEYLPGRRGTDARWLLEGELDLGLAVDPDQVGRADRYRRRPDPEAIITAARTALTEAGLVVSAETPIGEVERSGEGTYVELTTGDGPVWVSLLGPFVRDTRLPVGARQALERNGFLVVGAELADTTFDGLTVYYFGGLPELAVGDLLFYWQD